MSEYYATGSMRGSGIDSGDYYGYFYCRVCKRDYDLSGVIGQISTLAYADCPDCGVEIEQEL